MKILFLHGWHSVVGGVKPNHLRQHGHEVANPALDDDSFERALATAQDEFDRFQPQVVVGSSRGGAVALNLRSGATPLVLLCPAWRRWGTARTAKPGTLILHCPQDEVVPFADSEELLRASGLPPSALFEVGVDHRLADPAALRILLRACEQAVAPASSAGPPLTSHHLVEEFPPPSSGRRQTVLRDDPQARVVLFGFAAGAGLPRHQAPHPVLLQVVEGRAEVTLADVTQAAPRGAWFQLPPGLPHAIQALEPTLLLVTILK
jgi:quercetin dioxygenase-like cupin family protein